MNKKNCSSVVLLLCVGFLITGCVRTERAKTPEPSGFMNESDYALMKETRKEIAQLLYVNTKIDFKTYDKVLIEPITIWRVPDSKLENLPEEELEEVGRHLHAALTKEMGQRFEVVNTPGAGVIRVRFAISEASQSSVALDIITSVLPPGIAVNVGKRLSTGTHSFVGKAVVEGEFRDAATGDLLAAGLASRGGGKTLFDSSKLSSWGDVQAAFDKFAEGVGNTTDKLMDGTYAVEYKK